MEGLSSLTLKGREGNRKITAIMQEIRSNPLHEIAGLKVENVEDYLTSERIDRKSTRLNSSHVAISYAVFCLKKKTKHLKAPGRLRRRGTERRRQSGSR